MVNHDVLDVSECLPFENVCASTSINLIIPDSGGRPILRWAVGEKTTSCQTRQKPHESHLYVFIEFDRLSPRMKSSRDPAVM